MLRPRFSDCPGGGGVVAADKSFTLGGGVLALPHFYAGRSFMCLFGKVFSLFEGKTGSYHKNWACNRPGGRRKSHPQLRFKPSRIPPASPGNESSNWILYDAEFNFSLFGKYLRFPTGFSRRKRTFVVRCALWETPFDSAARIELHRSVAGVANGIDFFWMVVTANNFFSYILRLRRISPR